jgi:tetratricopeptide (TPR) repeat protein
MPHQVAAQYYHVMACYLSGDYGGTEHVCRRLLQSLQGEWTHERFGVATFPAVLSHSYLARALGERGVFDEGEAHGDEAIRIAEAVNHPYSLIFACLFLASLNSVRGELNQASRLLERAVAQCRDWNIAFLEPIVMASLGYVYAWSGRIEEGVSLLQQALTAHESAGIGYFQSISVVQLGEAYRLADQAEDARACADRALMLARGRGERGHEAWALRLLGEIAAHRDPLEVELAEAFYRQAFTLAEELGMRPLQAHCHRGFGTLYAMTGQREQARTALSTASEMYRGMEMTFWLPETEAALAQVDAR